MKKRACRAGLTSSLAEELAWDMFSICAFTSVSCRFVRSGPSGRCLPTLAGGWIWRAASHIKRGTHATVFVLRKWTMTSRHRKRGSVARIASSHSGSSRGSVVELPRVCLLLRWRVLRCYMLWWVMPWLRRRLFLHCEVEKKVAGGEQPTDFSASFI